MCSTPKAAGGSGGPRDDIDNGEDDEEGEESEQEVDDEEGDYPGDPDSPGPRVPKRAGNGSSRQAGNGDWGGPPASSSYEAPSGGLSGLEAIFAALLKSQNQGRSDMKVPVPPWPGIMALDNWKEELQQNLIAATHLPDPLDLLRWEQSVLGARGRYR